LTLESQSPPEFSAEFIEENKKIKFKNSKKGRRYSKEQRDKRQKEVYRLHFEYGYSARKISEMMKINRNTINGDIDYWFDRILKNWNRPMNPEISVVLNIQRLDIQRTRLRELLDKAKTIQEKMSIERLIYEIDCKISHMYIRVAESMKRVLEHSSESLNRYMKENKNKERFLTFSDRMSVSDKTFEKINRLIKQDKRSPPHPI
jgi:hypothetical protein